MPLIRKTPDETASAAKPAADTAVGLADASPDARWAAARAAGFRRLEMGATLTGVPFYRAKGYVELERADVALGDGLTLPIVRMGKDTADS